MKGPRLTRMTKNPRDFQVHVTEEDGTTVARLAIREADLPAVKRALRPYWAPRRHAIVRLLTGHAVLARYGAQASSRRWIRAPRTTGWAETAVGR